jgi:hypothetical protein
MNSLETQVLRLIGENVSSPDVFADTDSGIAQIRASINDALQELCMVTGSYIRTMHLPLLANQQFYKLTMQADYMGYVVQVMDRSRHSKLIRTDLVAVNSNDPYWMQNKGYPMEYMQIGLDYFGICGIPSDDGVVLEMQVVCIPKPYTADTDPLKVREAFQRSGVQLAVSEFYASRGDAARASEYLNKYLETAGIMQLNPQQPERIYQFGGYQGASWQDRRSNGSN